jgi:CRISPR system Cascade subunit CasA
VPATEPKRLRPAALERIAAAGCIPDSAVYTLRVFGQELGKHGGDIRAWYEEEVPAPVAVLRAQDQRLGYVIGLATRFADNIGSVLSEMESAYRRSFQADNDREIPTALAIDYWPHLPAPFGVFLRTLADILTRRETADDSPSLNDDILSAATAFGDTVRRIGNAAAAAWAENTARRERDLLETGARYEDYQRAVSSLRSTYIENLREYFPRPDEDE